MKIFDKFSEKEFEQEFTKEILISEVKRARILASICGAIFIVILFLFLFDNNYLQQISKSGKEYLIFEILAVGFVCEKAVQFLLEYFIRKKIQPPLISRYFNAFVETSMPTAIIVLVLSSFLNPVELLSSLGTYIYFFFIILSSVRLDFKLCIFTGFVAMAEYIIIAFYYINDIKREFPGSVFSFMTIHISKGALYLLGGLLAAYVASEVKKRIIKSFELINDRKKVIDLFGQHVSPTVVNKLLSQKAELDSEIRHVCIMFLDIRNFTNFSEKRKPEEVIEYLNSLFGFMIEIINQHNGIINKFLGDGFMAVFGAPFSDGNDCINAVSASREILQVIEQMSNEKQIPLTKLGIGLHAGEAVTGNVGSKLRKEYTIIGDVVNLASRIEQLNKQFNTNLLISESVWELINNNDIKAESVGVVTVKGREQPVNIFKIV
jgi:adenylate cyclase